MPDETRAHGSATGEPAVAGGEPSGGHTRGPVPLVLRLCIGAVRPVADHVPVPDRSTSPPSGPGCGRAAPLDADLLQETTDPMTTRVRDLLARLREGPAPRAFHPGTPRKRRGNVSGSAA